MGKRNALAKTLTTVGTAFVALPLLAPLVLSLQSIGRPGGYQLDYLMPFEVYPLTLVGVALLVWASFRAHARRGTIGIAIAGMIAGLALASAAAQVTGIANSVERLESWKYVLTASLAGVSLLAQAALVVLGWLLARDLFTTSRQNTPSGSNAPDA